VRTCFTSNWRLFSGQDTLSPGRYVRCPQGTPHFPGWHQLGSRDWTSDERNPWPALGEWQGARQYYSGAPPFPFPLPVLIGSADCLILGETEPASDRTFVSGFDSRCYLTSLLLPPVRPSRVDVNDGHTQSQLADIQEMLYNDAALAATMLQAFLGPGSTVSYVADGSGPYSGSLIGISPTQQVIMSSGTTNQQQWAFQLLYAGLGMTDYSTYSTNAQWFANAVVLNDRAVAAGIDLNKPITIVGHSYGGATALVLAGQILTAHPSADLAVLTYGAPRAGDSRLASLLKPIPQANIVAIGDPIGGLPPTGLDLLPFSLFVPGPLFDAYAQVANNGASYILPADGPLVQGDPTFFNWTLVNNAVLAAAIGNPQPTYAAHLMGYYADKLKLLHP